MEESDSHKAKRQRTDSRGLFKPPTYEELHMLKESGRQFHSAFFKMQAEELTKEMSVTETKKKHISEGLDQLRKALMSLPCRKVENLWSSSGFLGDVKVPWKRKSERISEMMLEKPVSVTVAGSYPLNTCSKSNQNVDIVIKLSSSVITSADRQNFQYHHKRAVYLAYVASHLKDTDIVEDLTFTLASGDPLRPVLAVILKGKALKKVTFNIHPCPLDRIFKYSQLSPRKSNLHKKQKEKTDKDEKLTSTAYYNSSILCDLCMEKHLQHLSEVSRDFPSFKESLTLLRVWLHQRELDKGHGGFTSFIFAMLISYLLQEKKLNKQMKSDQILRVTLYYLSQSNWTEFGISLHPEKKKISELPLVDDFHAIFDVVFVDQTGFLNLCAGMTRNTYEQVKYEASCTLEFLNDAYSDSFELLCMTPVPFYRKFDQIVQIRNLSFWKSYCRKLSEEDSVWERNGQVLYVALPHLLTLMEKALGNRVRIIGFMHPDVPKWKVDESPVGYNSVSSLTFGLLLNDEYSFNVLEKGPFADSPEAVDFKEFWGEKSEMRRFQDGSICEAVLWPGKTVAEKRLTCGHVIKHVFQRHAGVPPKQITVVINQLDELLKPVELSPRPQKGKNKNHSPTYPLDTGEEKHLEVFSAYLALSKVLRQLTDIPLGISSVQGISPVFRHAEVFPPSPVLEKAVKMETEGGAQVPSVRTPCPDFVPCFKVICHLESSGKWPDTVEAIQKIKTAFYIKISELLQRQYKVISSPTEQFLDVLQGGFVFRIEVAHVKELGLLKEGRSKLGHLVLKDNKASIALEKRTVALPRLTSALHGVSQEYKSFGLTARLAKRWVAAQLLSDHVSEESVELMVAHLFLHAAPFASPRSLITGFQRFLHLVSSYDWTNKPLIVNFNSELQAPDLEEINHHFANNRSQLPAMCIITPTERNSLWTQEQPTRMILHRLTVLARESLRVLEENLLEENASISLKQIFRPPMDGYDVIIHLASRFVPRIREAVDVNGNARFQLRRKGSVDKLPVTDFDPVRLYVEDLKDTFSELALFFYDCYGGDCIGVKWKLPAFEARPTKVSSMTAAMPNPSSTENVLSTVIPNVEGILADFRIMGQGLVSSIEVLSEKWKLK